MSAPLSAAYMPVIAGLYAVQRLTKDKRLSDGLLGELARFICLSQVPLNSQDKRKGTRKVRKNFLVVLRLLFGCIWNS